MEYLKKKKNEERNVSASAISIVDIDAMSINPILNIFNMLQLEYNTHTVV